MGWLSDLVVRVKGDNKGLKDSINDSEKSINKFGGSLRKLAGIFATVFGAAKIISFAKESARLYDIEARAHQELLVALKGREDIQQSLIRQASELQKKTLFGDEETVKAAARLAMLIGQNEVAIKRLLPLVQDLASAKFEGNLVTAADLVAKSIGSSTNALSRYGIEIKGAVGSADRLESAIEGLNRQVGGQAEAAAKVGLGSLKQLQNAWSDFKETVGKTIIETKAFGAVIDWLSKEVEIFNDKDLSFWEKINGSPDDYARYKEQQAEFKKNFIDNTNKLFPGLISGLEAVVSKKGEDIDTTEDQIVTLETLNAELEKEKELLNTIDVADTKSIQTQLRKIKALDEYIKKLGELPIDRVSAPDKAKTDNIKMPFLQWSDEYQKDEGWESLKGANIALEREMTIMEDILTSGRDMAFELGTQVIESIGEALAGGNIKDLGKGLLMSLASFLSQFGKLLITYGLGLEAFVASSETFNPIPALIAGAAMLVAAGAIRGLVGGASRGVSSSGGGGGAYSSGAGMQAQNMKVEVVGRISGKDLVISSKRYMNE